MVCGFCDDFRRTQITTPDSIVLHKPPVIHKVIEDGKWFEGGRCGRWVSASDPVVRGNVCRVVRRIGHQLRESLQQQMDSSQAA